MRERRAGKYGRESERDNGVPREKKTRWSRVLNPDAKAAPEISCDIGERNESQMNIFEYMNEKNVEVTEGK